MVHGDDSGLVLPPNLAPTQLVIVPIYRSEDDRRVVAEAIDRVQKSLSEVMTASGPLRVKVDWREESPGFKYSHWEQRGVPVRLEIGPRDVAAAQGVLVAPHAVFIDHRTRSGSVEIYNPSPDPVEVRVSTLYGFPVTDSLGQLTLATFEHPAPDAPSAAGWVEAFPRRLTLGPNQRQTIRLLARPPQGLPDGEYWTRLVIQSDGGRVAVEAPEESAISVGVTLSVRTLISLMYRKGALETGVRLEELRADVERDTLVVASHLTRLGTAAWLGTFRGTVVDEADREVASFSQLVGLYGELRPRFRAPLGPLPPGRYTVRVQLDTDREDLRGAPVLASPAVRDSVTLVVAPRGR